MRKKICIITGSRAEWGLFYPLASAIKQDDINFKLQLISTGAHLSTKFGMTCREIEKDGFKIDGKVRISVTVDNEKALIKSFSEGIRGFAQVLSFLKPDLVFLLGDRFETFSAATTCLFLKIPIAHIHGGELTEGSLDDTLRHCITKIAHLHFVSTETYRKRVIQMGEEPARVFNVGALGLDNIKNTKFLDKKSLEKEIGFGLGEKNLLVTFHPSTAEERSSSEKQLNNLLKVIGQLKDCKVLFTMPNPDIYAGMIRKMIKCFVTKHKDNCVYFYSMGRVLYLSTIQFVDVVAGNSSSGIIEVPSFGIPTINIGDRQKGRVKAPSIIDTGESFESIRQAFVKASTVKFRSFCKTVKNPHGDGNASRKILDILVKEGIPETKKIFFDMN